MCWTVDFMLLLDTVSVERMQFTTAGKTVSEKETWAPSACSRRKVTRRLKSEPPVWKSHPPRGRFPPESACLDDTRFTQSPSVHLQMIALMRNRPRSVWQQLPLPHLWSLCFWLGVRTQLKTIKARLGQRCVLTTVGGAGGQGIFNNSVLESESRRVFVLRVCKRFVLGPQIQDLEAWYSLRSVAVAMTARLNTAASVLGKRRKKNKTKLQHLGSKELQKTIEVMTKTCNHAPRLRNVAVLKAALQVLNTKWRDRPPSVTFSDLLG